MLVAIAGRKRAGKNSVGTILQDEWYFGQYAFADAVKRAAGVIFGLSPQEQYGLDGYDREQPIDRLNGMSSRYILQKLGTEVGRSIWSDVWVNQTLRNVGTSNNSVITDCRFPSEASAVRNAGGIVIKVVRPGWSLSGLKRYTSPILARLFRMGLLNEYLSTQLASFFGDHPSEFCVELIVEDLLIVNDGTLVDLEKHITDFMTEHNYRKM